jgi:crotonobetainyl-CoA:carnitine CoA-transferase CaiB-like acyl-CoA transferase
MERLGLGFETTSRRNPRLIHVSITGFGHDGPYRQRAGHDLNYISLAGVTGISGTRDGSPGIPGVQIADIAGGSLMAVTGLLAAVIQREHTGRGQFVDTSMFHGALSLTTMVLSGVEAGLDVPAPGSMLLNGRFPCYGLYRTADGRYMSLAALEFKFWQNFCSAVDREDLMDERFGGPEIISELDKLFASRTLDEWIELMKTSDTCCEPVLTLNEVLVSPLVEARNMVVREADGRRFLTSPLKMSDSSPRDDVPAPALGAHTAEVLSQLGIAKDRLDDLARQGVI